MLCSLFRCRPLITFALRYYRASLRKKYDSNHTRKGFEKSLIELSKTHKVLKITLSYKYLFTVYLLISIYLICDINYALFNHRLPLITSKTLYLFCQLRWTRKLENCGPWYKIEQNEYKPKNRPGGKSPSCHFRFLVFKTLLNKYTQKADELSDIGFIWIDREL